MGMTTRERAVYLARLAGQVGRYDEMADHMRGLSKQPLALSEEERGLFAVAYEGAVGRRLAARRAVTDACQVEGVGGGTEEQAEFASEYCTKIETELEKICGTACKWLNGNLLAENTTNELKVFYQKMKAFNFQKIAEFKSADFRKAAIENARHAYEEALMIARSVLPEMHPIVFSLSLRRAIFHSDMLSNFNETYETAPTPLRHLRLSQQIPDGFGCSGNVSCALIAQRLCDLLLEFPVAAISGVQWHIVTKIYNDLYTQELDIDWLGYASPLMAAKALLVDVLHQRRIGSYVSGDDATNPLLSVEDAVALTPLPGYASTWPSLYQSLCVIVRKFGKLDKFPAEAEHMSGASKGLARILVISQLTPLLKSLEDEARTENACDGIGPIHSLMSSHLIPMSKLKNTGFDKSILSFRDEEGTPRTLHKIGQLVQAMVRWRYQRAEWRRKEGVNPSQIDKALVPKLEVVFSKQYHNLVLCIGEKGIEETEETDFINCPEYYREYRQDLECAQTEVEFNVRAGGRFSEQDRNLNNGMVRGTRSRSNPLHVCGVVNVVSETYAREKQTSPRQPREVVIAETQTETSKRVMCSPEHNIKSICPSSKFDASLVEIMIDGEHNKNQSSHPQQCAITADIIGTNTAGISNSAPRASAKIHPPHGKRRRSRSLTKTDRARYTDDLIEDSTSPEMRSKSEPPQQRVVEIFDDPFEPPPQRQWLPPSLPSTEPDLAATKSFATFAFGLPTFGSVCMTLQPSMPSNCTNLGLTAHSPFPPVQSIDLPTRIQGNESANGMFSKPGWPDAIPAGKRAMSRNATSPTTRMRARSLVGTTGQCEELVCCEGCEPRSLSEPPHPCIEEVFDDPFEPPPQKLWTF